MEPGRAYAVGDWVVAEGTERWLDGRLARVTRVADDNVFLDVLDTYGGRPHLQWDGTRAHFVRAREPTEEELYQWCLAEISR